MGVCTYQELKLFVVALVQCKTWSWNHSQRMLSLIETEPSFRGLHIYLITETNRFWCGQWLCKRYGTTFNHEKVCACVTCNIPHASLLRLYLGSTKHNAIKNVVENLLQEWSPCIAFQCGISLKVVVLFNGKPWSFGLYLFNSGKYFNAVSVGEELTYQQAGFSKRLENTGTFCAPLKDFFLLGQKSSAQYLRYPAVLLCVLWLKGKKNAFFL